MAATSPYSRSQNGRLSHAQTPRTTCSARAKTIGQKLEPNIDGCRYVALVDMGAGYCVLSGPFAGWLKNVATAWDSPQIRKAGSHLITVPGRCTARAAVSGHRYPTIVVELQALPRSRSRHGFLGTTLSGHKSQVHHVFLKRRRAFENSPAVRQSPECPR